MVVLLRFNYGLGDWSSTNPSTHLSPLGILWRIEAASSLNKSLPIHAFPVWSWQNSETHNAIVRSRVKKFPAWHTKAAPNGKCCEGYIVPSMVISSQMWKVCWNKGRLCWKIAKLFYFCHLKKLVRPETFGPYYVCTHNTQEDKQSVTHHDLSKTSITNAYT